MGTGEYSNKTSLSTEFTNSSKDGANSAVGCSELVVVICNQALLLEWGKNLDVATYRTVQPEVESVR
jgi:hypothetical protein